MDVPQWVPVSRQWKHKAECYLAALEEVSAILSDLPESCDAEAIAGFTAIQRAMQKAGDLSVLTQKRPRLTQGRFGLG